MPARSIELNLAAKLALTTAALSRALDSHRVCAENLPVFVDDTVSPARHRGLGTTNSGGDPADKASSNSGECAATNDDPKHAKK